MLATVRAQLMESRRKETRVFSMTKRIFVFMVGLQVVMCAVAAALAGWYESSDLGAAWYLYSPTLEAVLVYAALRFCTWFIIVKDFIPISLYVSLELVQFIQALFMRWDAQMRVTLHGQELATRVNSSNLNEELAQVHYIFSDKTGTLTENSMVFKKCAVGDVRYGQGQTEAGLIRAAKEEGKDVKKAIAEFSAEKSRAKEEDEAAAKEGRGKDERQAHVEFDEMERIRELLAKSQRQVGECKEPPKKKGTDDEDGKAAKGGDEGDGKKSSKAGMRTKEKQPESRATGDTDKEEDGEGEGEREETADADEDKGRKVERGKKEPDEPRHGEQRNGRGGAEDEDGEDEDEATPDADGEETPRESVDTPTPKAEDRGGRKTSAPAKANSDSGASAKSPQRGGAPAEKKPKKDEGAGQKKTKEKKAGQEGGKGQEGGDKDDEEQAQLVRHFLYCLAINNSVFPKVKDEEEAGGEVDRDEEGDDDERGLMEVVVNPVVSAFGTAGETLTNVASDAVATVTSSFGGEEEGEGLEAKDIEEGEMPEAENQPDEEEKEGYGDANSAIRIMLEASSPDETALTAFAAVVGFELYSRNEGRVRLRVSDFGEQGGEGGQGGDKGNGARKEAERKTNDGQKGGSAGDEAKGGKAEGAKEKGGSGSDGDDAAPPETSRHFEDFEEVLMLDYNSKRKRMTVIVRPYDVNGQPMDHVLVYCKGADTSVGAFLADDDPYWDNSLQPALADFGGESLRTLVFAYAEKEADFYAQFESKMQQAQKSQGKEEKGHADGECGDECRLCAVENEIEEAAEMTALGCTGVEDKLQEGVPTALQALLDGGMTVWMLTGDTVSTAVNIAMACNLIDSDMENEGRLFVFDKGHHTISPPTAPPLTAPAPLLASPPPSPLLCPSAPPL